MILCCFQRNKMNRVFNKRTWVFISCSEMEANWKPSSEKPGNWVLRTPNQMHWLVRVRPDWFQQKQSKPHIARGEMGLATRNKNHVCVFLFPVVCSASPWRHTHAKNQKVLVKLCFDCAFHFAPFWTLAATAMCEGRGSSDGNNSYSIHSHVKKKKSPVHGRPDNWFFEENLDPGHLTVCDCFSSLLI